MAEDSRAPIVHPILASLLPQIPHHAVRITSQAKMTNLIAFALSHLDVRSSLRSLAARTKSSQDPLNPPIVFHTLPPPPPAKSAPLDGPSTSTPSTTTAQPPARLPSAPACKTSKKLSSSSAAVLPKLISVAEIVKRSYVPRLAEGKGKGKEEVPELKKKGKGKGRMLGLHQYSRLGALAELGLEDAGEEEEGEEQRMERIALEWIESGDGGRKRCVVASLGRGGWS